LYSRFSRDDDDDDDDDDNNNDNNDQFIYRARAQRRDNNTNDLLQHAFSYVFAERNVFHLLNRLSRNSTTNVRIYIRSSGQNNIPMMISS